MLGWAQLDFGGDASEAMHQRQFSMLLAAYLAGKSVRLEFVSADVTDTNKDGEVACSDNHNGVGVRFVLLR
jgi:hypothetical protein